MNAQVIKGIAALLLLAAAGKGVAHESKELGRKPVGLNLEVVPYRFSVKQQDAVTQGECFKATCMDVRPARSDEKGLVQLQPVVYELDKIRGPTPAHALLFLHK